jgi:asparagine synthase (glutamine-hydrolysing)
MPGIIGFTIPERSESEATRILKAMQDFFTHRNDDCRQPLFIDNRIAATAVQNRTPAQARQPCRRGSVYVWLDGEFYNRGAPNQQREVLPADDAELLAQLYGEDPDLRFLAAIDGIYSAAIYDKDRQKLYLISDRYGFRHLNWMVHRGQIVWTSELKALLALPDYSPQIDKKAIEEFLHIGWLLDNRTWFENTQLLPAASVLSWDLRDCSARVRRYWWWDRTKPIQGTVGLEEAAEELARLLTAAVVTRCRPGERVGITLSGGLDSRAILAAMPDRCHPIDAVTFGKRGCDDIRIAARAAALKGARHHVVELDSQSWLEPRIDAVWWTDGRKDLSHMSVLGAYSLASRLMAVVLDGAAGGRLKGIDLQYPNSTDNYMRRECGVDLATSGAAATRFREYYARLGNRYLFEVDSLMRSFTANGPKLATFFGLRYAVPFLDNRLQEFLYSVPPRLRANHALFARMLTKTFPQFVKNIPWQATGTSLGLARPVQKAFGFAARVRRRLGKDLRRLGIQRFDTKDPADHAYWLRQEPAISLAQHLLLQPSPLYSEFIDRSAVENAWNRHMRGRDESRVLYRCLTIELWLQQVFEKRYRPMVASGIDAVSQSSGISSVARV